MNLIQTDLSVCLSCVTHVLNPFIFSHFLKFYKFLTFFNFQEHLSLSEITCTVQHADKTLAIFTPLRSLHLQPVQLKFGGDLEMEAWQAHLTKGKTKTCSLYFFQLRSIVLVFQLVFSHLTKPCLKAASHT